MKSTLCSMIIIPMILFSQPSLKWASPVSDSTYMGWFTLRSSPLDKRFYIYNRTSSSRNFILMSSSLSNSPAYTINLKEGEDLACDPSEMNCDFSGDGLNDIVLTTLYKPSGGGQGRYALRVVDVTTGLEIIKLDDPSYSYFYGIYNPYSINYQYCSSDIDRDGSVELIVQRQGYPSGSTQILVYSSIGVETSSPKISQSAPNELQLHQNYPNPFNPSTVIEYEIPSKSDVVIEIFDTAGRQIKEFSFKNQNSGLHSFTWDGNDSRGSIVSSGVYFYKLKANGSLSSKKMVLVK